MSQTLCFIAAQLPRTRFVAEVLRLWPQFQVRAEGGPFPSFEALHAWGEGRSRYWKGPPGEDLKLFHEQGAWSVMGDLSCSMDGDAAQLSALSELAGRVVVAVTSGSSGTAIFRMYERGALRRELAQVDSRFSQTGAPLPEERVPVSSDFSVRELDSLWAGFGLGSFLASEPPGPLWALHVVDTEEAVPRDAPAKTVRPWWRFW